jgi:hypothetical protein
VVPGVPLVLYARQCPGGKAFNPTAFASPPTGQQGDFGRNLLGDPANELTIGVVERGPDEFPSTRNAAASLCSRKRIGRTVAVSAGNGQPRMDSADALTQLHHKAILRQGCVESPDALAVAVDDRWMQVVVDLSADAR